MFPLYLHRLRVWNYEDATILNSFSNHEFPDKGISKLCLINELDNSLLLAASSNSYFWVFLLGDLKGFVSPWFNPNLHDAGDGSIRIWKDYSVRSKQKLVTAFSSIPGHKPSVRCVNAVVDWQQQSGYMVRLFWITLLSNFVFVRPLLMWPLLGKILWSGL